MSAASSAGGDPASGACGICASGTPLEQPHVAVMHGVNLDQLGQRDPTHYGSIELATLERLIAGWARELGMITECFQTNHEGEFVEHLHGLRGHADAVILNPGAWTHYAYALHDALELTQLPAIEVHLSDVGSREPWRRHSVISDLCIATVAGKGADGYREALEAIRAHLIARAEA